MLKPQFYKHHHHQGHVPWLPPSLRPRKNHSISGEIRGTKGGNPTLFLSHNTLLAFPFRPHEKHNRSQWLTGKSSGQIKAVEGESRTTSVIETISIKAVITVQLTVGGALSNLSLTTSVICSENRSSWSLLPLTSTLVSVHAGSSLLSRQLLLSQH